MKVLIVYAHPNPDSFNRAILESATKALLSRGFEVRLKDLYMMGFDPLYSSLDALAGKNNPLPDDVKNEQADILWANRLMFIYPIWWFDRPAILKGWCDRVLTNGFAFKHSSKGEAGLLKHEKALIFQTTGGDKNWFKENGADKTIQQNISLGTLDYCGIKDINVHTFYSVVTETPDNRKEMLSEVSKIVSAW